MNTSLTFTFSAPTKIFYFAKLIPSKFVAVSSAFCCVGIISLTWPHQYKALAHQPALNCIYYCVVTYGVDQDRKVCDKIKIFDAGMATYNGHIIYAVN